MQKNINYGAIISVILAVVLIAGAYWAYSSNSDLRTTLYTKENALLASQENVLTLGNKVDELGNKITDLQAEIQAKETELIAKETELIEKEVETEIIEKGYLIENIYINKGVNEELTSKQLDLLKGEVSVDDEKYKFEEILHLKGLNVTANGKDYGSKVYSVLNADEIKYAIEFKKEVEKITEDEPLIFNFLGKEIEIIDWNDTKIKVVTSERVTLGVGQSATVKGKTFTVDSIFQDSVVVNGKFIADNKSKKISELRVKVDTIGYHANSLDNSIVVLKIGEDTTYEDRDEYEEDSVWNWEITNKSIGITLDETLKWLDDENLPLGKGDKICLPNDYRCVKFNGLEEVSYQKISFKVKDNGDLRITGDNLNLEVKNGETKFYDLKEKENYTEIELDNSDLVIEFNNDGTRIGIRDITNGKILSVKKDITDVKVDSNSVQVEQKDDYRTLYGIIVKNTEKIAEDQVLDILVPEEKVSASFLIY